MRKYWIMAIVAIGIFAFGIAGYHFTATSPSAAKEKKQEIGASIGDIIPEFTLTGIDGKEVNVGKDKKIAVLNFWATWCPPCRAEFPELVRFSQKNSGSVNFYSINLQEDKSKISVFFNKGGYFLPVLLDQDGQIAKMFRVTAIPTTIIVDAKGVIRYRKSGAVTADELENSIKGL